MLLGVWLLDEETVSAAEAVFPVEGAVTTGFLVSATKPVVGAVEGEAGSAFEVPELLALEMSILLVADGGSDAGALGDRLELPALATFFDGVDGAFTALPALVADGDAGAAFRLEALSAAALALTALSTAARPLGFATPVRASAAAAALSPVPLALAGGAGGVVDSSVTAGGVAGAWAVFAGSSMVRLSRSAPPITIAMIAARAKPK